MTKLLKIRELTKEIAEEIAENLSSGLIESEVRKKLNLHGHAFNSWIADAVFGSPEKRSPEKEIIRQGVLNSLLGESIIRKALTAASTPQQKKSTKVTTLLGLSKQEKEGLERSGYIDFIENFQGYSIVLKVEESKEEDPPVTSLLDKLLRVVEGNVSVEDIARQLMSFPPKNPDCPDV